MSLLSKCFQEFTRIEDSNLYILLSVAPAYLVTLFCVFHELSLIASLKVSWAHSSGDLGTHSTL